MKARVVRVGTKPVNPEIFSFVEIILVPETEKEKRMVAEIAENQQQLAKKESSDEVAEVDYFSCDLNTIRMEISFPKPVQ
jgi:hypothetical protein